MKIAIVTPVRNAIETIDQCVQSVLSQIDRGGSFDLQYVVMDGASDDGSTERLRTYEGELHFFSSQPDRGPYDAVNRGFAHTDADVLGWLNADDLYCPWALQTVASVFENLPDCEWLTTRNPAALSAGGHYVGTGCVTGYSREAIRRGGHHPQSGEGLGYIQQESTFFRRSLWEAAGGELHQDYSLAGDFELWMRMARHASLDSVPVPLALFRHRVDQRSADRDAYERQAAQAIRDHGVAPRRPPASSSTRLRRLLRCPRYKDHCPVLNVVDASAARVKWERTWTVRWVY